MSDKPTNSPRSSAGMPRGEAAPPIRAEDLDALLNAPAASGVVMSDPQEKRKAQQQTLFLFAKSYTYVVLVAAALVLVLAIIMVVLFTTASVSEVRLLGDERIEAPNRLPALTSDNGSADAAWQRGTLTSLEWDAWRVRPSRAGTLTVYVRGVEGDTVPIVGLYDADGGRVATSATRTGVEKEFSYPVRATTSYTLLVSSIGGAAGSYEVRVGVR